MQRFLLFLATLLSASGAAAQGPPASVVLDEVLLETVSQQREATGQIVTLRRSALATQEDGLVVELALEAGDSVRAGQVIARLDDARARLRVQRWQAQVASDEAVVEQRKAELAQAERDKERIDQVASLGSAGVSEIDDAVTLVQSRRAQLSAAEAELMTDRAELALAERTLADMTIRAPFDGRVVVRQAEIGQWVSVGDPIVTIVSLTQLEARVDVPENAIVALSSTQGGIEIDLPALGFERLTGEVIEIVPEADALSRLFPVRILVNDPESRLRPGMSLTAMIPTGLAAPAITISKDAIMRNQAGEFVYFDAGGSAQVAPIERLFSTGQRVAVRSPVLRAGTRIVIEGNERLYPTQGLMVLNADQFPDIAERQRAAAAAMQQGGSQGGPPADAPEGEG